MPSTRFLYLYHVEHEEWDELIVSDSDSVALDATFINERTVKQLMKDLIDKTNTALVEEKLHNPEQIKSF